MTLTTLRWNIDEAIVDASGLACLYHVYFQFLISINNGNQVKIKFEKIDGFASPVASIFS